MSDILFGFLSLLSNNYTLLEALIFMPSSVLLSLYGFFYLVRNADSDYDPIALIALLIVASMVCFHIYSWNHYSKEASVVYDRNLITLENFDEFTHPHTDNLIIESIHASKDGNLRPLTLDTSKNIIYELDVVKQKWGTEVDKLKYVSKENGQLVDHTEYLMTHNSDYEDISSNMYKHLGRIGEANQNEKDHEKSISNQMKEDNKTLDDMLKR